GGLELLTWRTDTFGYAEEWDESSGRYRGLRGGQLVEVSEDNTSGLLVRPEAVRRQEEAETPPEPLDRPTPGSTGSGTSGWASENSGTKTTTTVSPPVP